MMQTGTNIYLLIKLIVKGMNLLRSIISLYEEVFKNDSTEPIFNRFNVKEKRAVGIILNNLLLDDSLLKSKLSHEIYNSKPDNPSFRSFISTLEKKTVIIASMARSKGSEIQKIRFSLIREHTAVQNLFMLGIYEPGIKLGKKLYKKAIYYHDYRTALNVAETLFQYLVSFGNNKEALKYDKIYKEVDKICKAEHESKLMFSKVLDAEKSDKFTIQENEYFAKWLKLAEQTLYTSSSDFHFFFYQIKLKLSHGDEYELWCKKAIEYFENLYFNHSAFTSTFHRRLVHYKFENGNVSIATLKLLKEVIDEVKPYSDAWYRYVHTMVKILLNLEDYNESTRWINKVLRSKKYRFIPKEHRNEWQLIQMYSYLLKGEYDEVNIRKIKYNLNYNETQKSSDNIPFLIGELIYLLKTGETDLDRKMNHLRNTLQSQCKGNELERGLGFCDAVQKGQKFKAKKSKTSFQNEYVFYEKLLEKV